MSESAPDSARAEDDASFTCDFCGAEVPRVRRVALDRGYDRLQTPHRVRYACPTCSARKEQERDGRGEREGGPPA